MEPPLPRPPEHPGQPLGAPAAGGPPRRRARRGGRALPAQLESPTGWGYSADTAQTVLTTIVASAVGLTGFVVTVSVLVVQMATGTFSPRYMRLWFRDRALRGVLAVSVGTVTFAFSLLRRIEENQVPDLAVTFAGFLLGAALVLFLVFFDRVLHRMRPVKVAALVARAGRRTVERAAGGSPGVRGRRGRGARRRAAGPGRPQPSPRRDPGHRPPGGGPLGGEHRVRRGPRARRGRLRVVRRDPLRGPRARGGPRGRRAAAAGHGGARRRAHPRAGPGLRAEDPGGHRDPGAVARGQRPDHRRPGAGPPRGRPRGDGPHAGARGELGVPRRRRERFGWWSPGSAGRTCWRSA